VYQQAIVVQPSHQHHEVTVPVSNHRGQGSACQLAPIRPHLTDFETQTTSGTQQIALVQLGAFGLESMTQLKYIDGTVMKPAHERKTLERAVGHPSLGCHVGHRFQLPCCDPAVPLRKKVPYQIALPAARMISLSAGAARMASRDFAMSRSKVSGKPKAGEPRSER
jgi:hypothetical protein